MRSSKTMEVELAALEEEHRKCERGRNKAKEWEVAETQTVEEEFVEREGEGLLKIEMAHMKRRKSKINKMLSTPIGGG